MVIKYNIDNKSYYLRDLGDGSGTFVKLDVPLVIIFLVLSKNIRSLNMVISYLSGTPIWLCNSIQISNLRNLLQKFS